MAKTVCEMIFRLSHGHYGGFYVEVPKEHYEAFKKLFPKGAFPRRVKEKNVADALTDAGEERFHKKFPASRGIYYDLYFADRSKGMKRLEDLMDACNFWVSRASEVASVL